MFDTFQSILGFVGASELFNGGWNIFLDEIRKAQSDNVCTEDSVQSPGVKVPGDFDQWPTFTNVFR